MAKRRSSTKTRDNKRTFNVGTRANVDHPRDALVAKVWAAVVTAAGVATQQLLERLQEAMCVTETAAGELQAVDLYLPLTSEALVDRVKALVEQPRALAPTDKGPKEAARPRYKNSYRMEEIAVYKDKLCVRCRVAERFSWTAEGGAQKGQVISDVEGIDATIGLQALLKSWVPIDWENVPSSLRAGACQQAAQQFNSHVGLLAKHLKAAFPSLLSRDPGERERVWRQSLDRIGTTTHVLERQRARDVHPTKYAADDPRGDRFVIVDPDWCLFVRSPYPERQPLTFVKSDDVVVYWCEADKRLYAAVPLFTGVALHSPLGKLATRPEFGWWKRLIQERERRRRNGESRLRDVFRPLRMWRGKRLTLRQNVLLVQLETRNPEYVMKMLSGQAGHRINWSLVTEKRGTHDRDRNRRHWVLHLAASREVVTKVRPHTLGIHFGTEPVVWWTLMDENGDILKEGKLTQNVILTEGLRRQLRLQEEQGKQRWVGQLRYAKELRRRTDEVAKEIVALAAQLEANLALEKITWVEKRRGGPDLNRRHSMWNFSQLPGRIEWLGVERREHRRDDPIITVRLVSDYPLRYTCPRCGACRKPKQTRDNADTWRDRDMLFCRKCPYQGPVADWFQARLVAREGVVAAAKLKARVQDQEV